jgi:hypothetical protein
VAPGEQALRAATAPAAAAAPAGVQLLGRRSAGAARRRGWQPPCRAGMQRMASDTTQTASMKVGNSGNFAAFPVLPAATCNGCHCWCCWECGKALLLLLPQWALIIDAPAEQICPAAPAPACELLPWRCRRRVHQGIWSERQLGGVAHPQPSQAISKKAHGALAGAQHGLCERSLQGSRGRSRHRRGPRASGGSPRLRGMLSYRCAGGQG